MAALPRPQSVSRTLTGTIPRVAADSLVASARASRIGGQDGEKILVNGHNKLRAQQFVGVLGTPSAALEILPKIDGLDTGDTRNCLVHMLARVFDLNISSGAMADLGWQRHDLLEVLIRLFCDRLFEAVHRGLSRRYVDREDDLKALRGRLNVKRQFTVLVSTPQKPPTGRSSPPGELIDHGEHAKLSPIVCSIHDEVIGPDVIGPARPQTDAGIRR